MLWERERKSLFSVCFCWHKLAKLIIRSINVQIAHKASDENSTIDFFQINTRCGLHNLSVSRHSCDIHLWDSCECENWQVWTIEYFSHHGFLMNSSQHRRFSRQFTATARCSTWMWFSAHLWRWTSSAIWWRLSSLTAVSFRLTTSWHRPNSSPTRRIASGNCVISASLSCLHVHGTVKSVISAF